VDGTGAGLSLVECFSVIIAEPSGSATNKRAGTMVKVKCTLVQALRLCIGCMAHRGTSGIAQLFHDRCTRRG
jgi:hypothetical protein